MIDFIAAITALRLDGRDHAHGDFPWIYPTPEEREVADTLEEIQAEHVVQGEQCCCGWPYPCPSWRYGEELAQEHVWRGAQRYVIGSQASIEHHDAR